MSRILLATDSYHFAPTANGICVEEIADELKKQGHDVHVLCFRHGKESYEDNINSIKIHRIKMDWVNRLRFLYEKKLSGWKQIVVKDMMIFLNRAEAMLFLYWFPMRSFLFCERYKRKIEALQKKYSYDIIVSSYSPFEAAYSIAKMNKKYNIKKCLYTLDSLTNLKQRFFLSHEYQDKKGWRWEQKIYNQCDLILNLKCHERHYSQSRYDKFRAKMKIVDIPHMIPFDIEADQGNLSGYTMLYAGNFYKDIAKDVFDVLSDYILSDTLTLEIYGRNDRESLQGFTTNEMAEKIVFGGFLDRQEILKKEKQTDILLSIGCPGTDFISSKIFEYIAFGGKILHLYKGKNDPNYKYFEKYRNACCINLEFSMDDNKKRIEEFLRTKAERIPFEQISELYKENLPSYTTQFIAGESNKSWGGYFTYCMQALYAMISCCFPFSILHHLWNRDSLYLTFIHAVPFLNTENI